MPPTTKRKREATPDVDLCCDVCREVLLDPVTLPCCGRSLDLACIEAHLSAHPHEASCPVCSISLPATVPPVAAELRNMVEVAYPEAVGRRRAEALRALFTEELRRLVPYGRPADYHAALVERVERWLRRETCMERLRAPALWVVQEEIRLLECTAAALEAAHAASAPS